MTMTSDATSLRSAEGRAADHVETVGAEAFDRIVNDTSWPVALLRHQSAAGRASLVVIVKRTSIWSGRTLHESHRQLPVFGADVPWPDGAASTLRFESDMVPYKPRADVVLVGEACAPGGRAVEVLDVGLRLGARQHRLRVFGDRQWQRTGGSAAIGRAVPFSRKELRYERAFGGIDVGEYCVENPVGRGLVSEAGMDQLHGRLLPNIEDPRDLVHDWRSRPKPRGFAFYGRAWQPRLGCAGAVDDGFRRSASAIFPAGFSYGFFNGGHPDLQVAGWLRGDEEIELVNLAEEGLISFGLPGAAPRVTISRRRIHAASAAATTVMDTAMVAMRLDTLVIVPEHRSLYEVFRGAVELSSVDSLEIERIRVGTSDARSS